MEPRCKKCFVSVRDARETEQGFYQIYEGGNYCGSCLERLVKIAEIVLSNQAELAVAAKVMKKLTPNYEG